MTIVREYRDWDVAQLMSEADTNGTNGYELAHRLVTGTGTGTAPGLDAVIKSRLATLSDMDIDVAGFEMLVEQPTESGTPFQGDVNGLVGLQVVWFTNTGATGNNAPVPDNPYCNLYAYKINKLAEPDTVEAVPPPLHGPASITLLAEFDGDGADLTAQRWLEDMRDPVVPTNLMAGVGDGYDWVTYGQKIDFQPDGNGVTVSGSGPNVTGLKSADESLLTEAGFVTDDPYITTRDHFDTSGRVGLRSFYTDVGYDAAEFPPNNVPGDGTNATYTGTGSQPAELVVFVHGIWNEPIDAVYTFDAARTAFSNAGYLDPSHPLVGYSWDSDIYNWPDIGWGDAKTVADENGPKLGTFIQEYKNANGSVDVRIVAHSLGARVTLEALKYIDEETGMGQDVVKSVSFLGGAVSGYLLEDGTGTKGPYVDPVANVAEHVDNFYSRNDNVLRWAFRAGEAVNTEPTVLGKVLGTAMFTAPARGLTKDPIGLTGCDDALTPANYHDHKTNVSSHTDYYYSGEGCINDVVTPGGRDWTN